MYLRCLYRNVSGLVSAWSAPAYRWSSTQHLRRAIRTQVTGPQEVCQATPTRHQPPPPPPRSPATRRRSSEGRRLSCLPPHTILVRQPHLPSLQHSTARRAATFPHAVVLNPIECIVSSVASSTRPAAAPRPHVHIARAHTPPLLPCAFGSPSCLPPRQHPWHLAATTNIQRARGPQTRQTREQRDTR